MSVFVEAEVVEATMVVWRLGNDPVRTKIRSSSTNKSAWQEANQGISITEFQVGLLSLGFSKKSIPQGTFLL
jgi:hypothetical protein